MSSAPKSAKLPRAAWNITERSSTTTDEWAAAKFDQFIASKDSPETAASLKAATQIFFSLFTDKRYRSLLSTARLLFRFTSLAKKLLIIAAPPELRADDRSDPNGAAQ